MKIKNIIGLLFLSIALHSCIRSEIEVPCDIPEGEPVLVSLSVNMAQMGSKAPTKATPEVERTINTLRVMVFAKNGSLTTNKVYTNPSGKVTVTTYSGSDQTIYMVANATATVEAKLVAVTTLPQIKEIKTSRTDMALQTVDKFGEHNAPLMMSGIKEHVDIETGSGQTIDDISLRFTVAKLTLNVSDATPTAANQTVTITGWDIVNEPTSTWAWSTKDTDPDPIVVGPGEEGTPSDWSSTDGRYPFTPRDPLTGAGNEDVKETATMSNYLIENRRGGRWERDLTQQEKDKYGDVKWNTKDDNYWYKTLFAPKRATYIKIYAIHADLNKGETKTITATIYIGNNAKDDYNVVRGNEYTFNVKVKGWDNIEVDSNVDYDAGEVLVAKGTDLRMDTHTDARALTMTTVDKAGYMSVEIVNNDAPLTPYNKAGFNATWLKISPLNLMDFQVKQADTADPSPAMYQEGGKNINADTGGIPVGGYARARYYPHKSVRDVIANDKKWWYGLSAYNNFEPDDDKLPFESATRRMCYSIYDMPFARGETKSIFIYSGENLSANLRSAKIKISFYAQKQADDPGQSPLFVTYYTVEQVGFRSIYSDLSDTDEGLFKQDESGKTIGDKTRFVIEQFEELTKLIVPDETMRVTTADMQWGFTDQSLYGGVDKHRNGRYLTLNSVFSDVTRDANDSKPIWTNEAKYRELYGREGSKGYQSFTGDNSGAPYFYPKHMEGATYHPFYNISAARYCYEKNRDVNGDGKLDPSEVKWYLPARDQMLMLLALREVILTDIDVNDTWLGFWTSTGGEGLDDYSGLHTAYVVQFGSGYSPAASKDNTFRVRCVRDIDPGDIVN